MQGRVISAATRGSLEAPAARILRGQVLGAIVAPLTAIAGLLNAPLQNLYGLSTRESTSCRQVGEAVPRSRPNSAT